MWKGAKEKLRKGQQDEPKSESAEEGARVESTGGDRTPGGSASGAVLKAAGALSRLRNRSRSRKSSIGHGHHHHRILEEIGFDRAARLSINRNIFAQSTQGGWSNMPLLTNHAGSSYSNVTNLMGPPGGGTEDDDEEQKMEEKMEEELEAYLGKEYHVEQLSLQIYKHLAGKKLPNFMQRIEFDKDGGLDKIAEIWNKEKYMWSAFLFLSILFNVTMIISTNWTVFHEVVQYVSNNYMDVERLKTLETELEHGQDQEVTADLFTKSIQDDSMRKRLLVAASAVAFMEVCYLIWNALLLIYRCMQACGISCTWRPDADETHFWRFRAITRLCHEQLPALSTFSAIKLMAKVHPSLVMADFARVHLESRWKYTKGCNYFITTYFIVERLVCMWLAVVAFAVKMCTVVFKLLDPTLSRIIAWFSVVALLNQCMGVLMLSEVLERRVFLFIFGGPDSDYQEDERALEIVYRCRVAQKIYEDYWVGKDRASKMKAFAMLTTFDHFDVQFLLINDVEEEQERQGRSP